MGDVGGSCTEWTQRVGKGTARPSPVSALSPPPRVLMVPQVPRVWLVKGALLVCPVSVVREDSLASPAHR